MSFILTDPTALKVALKEEWIGYSIGRVLKRHYPRYDWIVRVDIESGCAAIHCPFISNEYGCVVHLNYPIAIIQQRSVMLAGELLERFRLPRGRASKQELLHIPRTALGYTRHLKQGGY